MSFTWPKNLRPTLTLAAGLVFLGVTSRAARAESDADLEKQILSGAPSALSPSTNAPPEAPSAAPTDALPDERSTMANSAPPPQPDPEAEREKEKNKVKSQLKEVDDSVSGPHHIPFSQILVVQYRYIRKEGTHEITPITLGIQPADTFRKQISWGFGYAYHFSEDFGIEAAHVEFYQNLSTGLADTIHQQFGLYTDRFDPVMTAGSALLWTPLKSKAATGEDIHYFEGYFLGGGGFSKYENGTFGMAQVGVGFRAYLTQTSLFKVEVRDYVDFTSTGTVQRVNILAGATILIGGSGSR